MRRLGEELQLEESRDLVFRVLPRNLFFALEQTFESSKGFSTELDLKSHVAKLAIKIIQVRVVDISFQTY